MLTKSKIKMEDSLRQIHHDAPYFNKYQTRNQAYMYKQPDNYYISNVNSHKNSDDHYNNIARHESYQVTLTDNPSKKYTSAKNQIIKELRQQYEILKNLSIQDNIIKNQNKDKYKYSQNSSLSSSMHSKKMSKVKDSDIRSPKQNSKQIQTLHIEKKQLQIVISNSMRKIQQLLNNEILLKKTIHQLKNQIQGKGGISQEYQKKIKAILKNEEQLHGQLNKVKHQNQRHVFKVKELSQKIKSLENQISNKQRQIKINFQEQRKLHELIKLQKDKYLHLEIQCKTFKMEYDLLQKEKNNQINRLKRQFQSFQGGNEKQMLFMVRRLQEELKQKDKRYSQLVLEMNKNKNNQFYQTQDKIVEKSYLEEILSKSKEITQNNSKALADNMSIILLKMAQIEKKNEENLKKSRDQAKRKPSEFYQRPLNQTEVSLLQQKIRELQRIINLQQSEKKRLIEQIKRQKELKFQVQDKNKVLERKIKQLQDQNQDLQEQIRQLNHTNNQNTQHTYGHHQTLRQQINTHLLRIKQLQIQKQSYQENLEKIKFEYNIKEKRFEDEIKQFKRYENEIRALQRQNDELRFEIEKTTKTGEFNLSMFKTQQEAEVKRLIFENQSINQRLKIAESQLVKIKAQSIRDLKIKDEENIILKKVVQDLKIKSQEDLVNQKTFYQQKINQITSTNIEQIKIFNEKFLNITKSNEKLAAQITNYSSVQGELNELRRYLKQTRTMNQGIDHLWHVKQAQYNNINEILSSIYL